MGYLTFPSRALKQLVLAHVDVDVQISLGAAVDARVAVAADVENLGILDARGNRDVDRVGVADSARAAALAAG